MAAFDRVLSGIEQMDQCFDNIRLASLPQIDLTTVAQPKEEMAVRAVKMLIRKIEKQSSAPAFEIIEPALVERSSCQSPLA